MRETGGDAGGEEGSVAVDEAFAARRFAFCRAFFAFLLSYADSGAWGRMPGITIMLDCAPEKTTLGGLAPVKFSRRPRRRLKKAHNLPSQFSAAGKKREKCYENLVLFWGDAGATGP